MDYDASTSCDTATNSPNFTSLPGCEKPVPPRHQQVPLEGDEVHLTEGYFAKLDGIYFYNEDDDEDNEGPVRICSPLTAHRRRPLPSA